MVSEEEALEKFSEAIEYANCDPGEYYRDFLITRTRQDDDTEYEFEKIDFHSNILTSLNRALTEQLRTIESELLADQDEEDDEAYRELVPFSAGNHDSSPTPIQYVDINDIPNNQRFRSVLNDVTINNKSDFSSPGDISYQTFRVKGQMQPKMVAFSQFTTTQIVGRNSAIKVVLTGEHEYNRIEEDPVALPEEFHAIYYDGLIFVLKPKKFERIFDYFDAYEEDAEEFLSYVEESDLNIAEFEKFRTTVLNSESQLRRMRQIRDRGRHQDLTRGLVEQMVSEFDVAVEIGADDDGTWQIEIPDFRKVNEVLNLFDDDFVVSGIDTLSDSEELQKYLAKGGKEAR